MGHITSQAVCILLVDLPQKQLGAWIACISTFLPSVPHCRPTGALRYVILPAVQPTILRSEHCIAEGGGSSGGNKDLGPSTRQ